MRWRVSAPDRPGSNWMGGPEDVLILRGSWRCVDDTRLATPLQNDFDALVVFATDLTLVIVIGVVAIQLGRVFPLGSAGTGEDPIVTRVEMIGTSSASPGH